ncbi:unnamed protein product [Rhizophagus irregularis]|nr:unnamed protein product [Rhizophagus irregularis]CAB5331928.1 unnamed protein product [Rhizophagus irregularis]
MKLNDQNTEHQLEDVIAESSIKNSSKSYTKLNIKAILYILKEKEHTITFAEMACRNLDVSSERDIFPTPPGNRQKINSTKCTASDSKIYPAKKKQFTSSQAHYVLQKLGRFG